MSGLPRAVVVRALTVVASATLVLAGCGGDGANSADDGASTSSSPSASPSVSPSPSPTAGSASASDSPSASTSEAPEAGFSRKELKGLHDVMYDAANDERATKDQYFATDPGRVKALLDTVATEVPAHLTRHPAGGAVHLAYLVAPYDSSQLGCAPDDRTVEMLMVAGKDGVAFTTIVATGNGTSFRIYDYAQAGQAPFDKDGFNVGSGGCDAKSVIKPMASRDIALP